MLISIFAIVRKCGIDACLIISIVGVAIFIFTPKVTFANVPDLTIILDDHFVDLDIKKNDTEQPVVDLDSKKNDTKQPDFFATLEELIWLKKLLGPELTKRGIIIKESQFPRHRGNDVYTDEGFGCDISTSHYIHLIAEYENEKKETFNLQIVIKENLSKAVVGECNREDSTVKFEQHFDKTFSFDKSHSFDQTSKDVNQLFRLQVKKTMGMIAVKTLSFLSNSGKTILSLFGNCFTYPQKNKEFEIVLGEITVFLPTSIELPIENKLSQKFLTYGLNKQEFTTTCIKKKGLTDQANLIFDYIIEGFIRYSKEIKKNQFIVMISGLERGGGMCTLTPLLDVEDETLVTFPLIVDNLVDHIVQTSDKCF